MDTVTHLALGACTGEILLGKKLGKKALLWGALAQNLPDIDTFITPFYRADEGYLIHRGITHSLFFAVVAGLCLAMIARGIHRKEKLPMALLAYFFCFELALHDLLDTCNSYGTALLAPFSPQRFSIHLLYVADPLFTISLIVAALLLAFKTTSNHRRLIWAYTGIFISAVYLCFAAFCKLYIDTQAEAAVVDQGVRAKGYFSTPAPFNCMLWYIAAETGNGYYTRYSSIWDDFKQTNPYSFHAKNYPLIPGNVSNEVLHNLREFSGGDYTISAADDGLYLNVVKFEQVQGWRDPNAPFAFSYPLTSRNADGLILQRGRFIGWNATTFQEYLDRIAGKQIETLN